MTLANWRSDFADIANDPAPAAVGAAGHDFARRLERQTEFPRRLESNPHRGGGAKALACDILGQFRQSRFLRLMISVDTALCRCAAKNDRQEVADERAD